MSHTPAELAREGKLKTIFAQIDLESDSRGDRNVYKWLCYAADLGHDSDDLIQDVLEVGSLRYDDDGYEQAAARWELAVAYLLETDGLTFDAASVRNHLEAALTEYSLANIAECTKEPYDADEVLAALKGDRKALLEEVLADGPYRKIRHRLKTLKELHQMKSPPKPMLMYAATALAKAVRDLVGDDVKDGVFVPPVAADETS
jgi:hypothetical protein